MLTSIHIEILVNRCKLTDKLNMYEYEPGLWFLENNENYIVASARETDTNDKYYMLGYIEATMHSS